MDSPLLRRFFGALNRTLMVPLYRLGLGVVMGNPFAGYVMVLRTIGRKTGKVRFVPVNYALVDGAIYCLAGWGTKSQWYRNLMRQPVVEAMLPTRAVAGIPEEVTAPDERLRAARRVLIASGFAGYLLGVNPRKATDEELRDKIADLPVVRIRPTGIGGGSCDPGGWFWVTGNVAALGALVALILALVG
jgi:deazaflavin-dependent oxidoreductase (nitroreductase family)